MVDEAAHLWRVAQFLSALAGDPHDADLLAATQSAGPSRCHPSRCQARNLKLHRRFGFIPENPPGRKSESRGL